MEIIIGVAAFFLLAGILLAIGIKLDHLENERKSLWKSVDRLSNKIDSLEHNNWKLNAEVNKHSEILGPQVDTETAEAIHDLQDCLEELDSSEKSSVTPA